MSEIARDETLARAWERQAQHDVKRGVIECRLCRRRSVLDQSLTVWRNGALVFAVCDDCAAVNHVLFTPTERGIEVRAKRKEPYVIVGGGS